MFVNQEITDHFPGEFTNFYLVLLKKDFPEHSLKSQDKIEVKGKDQDTFLYKDSIEIKKSDTEILKKMIKAVKNNQ